MLFFLPMKSKITS
uniref:Uncharacterized protein n=1 Tax=Arundo donax TaxID=35708 RepID=A0A0A8YD06_ARUDO